MKAKPLSPERLAPTRPRGDDLERIHGIGPALARRLRAAGVATCAGLAGLTTAELARRVPGLSEARIKKEGWLRQARRLSRIEKSTTPVAAIEPGRQSYATFTLDLLLNETGAARRSRIVHVQTGDTETWTGWKPEGLIAFLSRHSGAAIPLPAKSDLRRAAPRAARAKIIGRPQPNTPLLPETPSAVARAAGVSPEIALHADAFPAEAVAPPTATPVEAVRLEAGPALPDPSTSATPDLALRPPSTPGTSTRSELSARLRIRRIDAATDAQAPPRAIFTLGQHFVVRLHLEMVSAPLLPGGARDYQALVSAKSLGRSRQVYMSEAWGRLSCQPSLEIVVVEGPALPRGLFRLSAALWLGQGQTETDFRPCPGLNTTFEDGLLQIR